MRPEFSKQIEALEKVFYTQGDTPEDLRVQMKLLLRAVYNLAGIGRGAEKEAENKEYWNKIRAVLYDLI